MKDFSVGPMNLLKAISVNGMVPVRHMDGLPSSWEYHPLEDGNRRCVPVYNPRVHDLLIPENMFSVRQHPNGRNYLCCNPTFRNDEPRDNPGMWEVVRCDGGLAQLRIELTKALEEPASLKLSLREAPVVIPANQKSVLVSLQACSDAIHTGKPISIVSIDSEDLVDPTIFDIKVEIIDNGRLVTGQSKLQPNWCY